MPWEASFQGRILNVEQRAEGYLVAIDLDNVGNCTFFIWMQQEPRGNYLRAFVDFEKAASRFDISDTIPATGYTPRSGTISRVRRS